MDNINFDTMLASQPNININKLNEEVDAEIKEEDLNIVIQNMISDFLKGTNQPALSEIILKAEGTPEETGKLTATHIKLLQAMIKDYYASVGGNIENLAAQRGIVLEEGKLSSIENETLEILIGDYYKGLKKIVAE